MLEFVNFLLMASAKLGYGGIVLLMAVESSFIPFPSEIVIPPAAYLAQQGQMNIYLVIAAGIAGSLIGASINYFLALTLGRRVVYSLAKRRIARVLLIDEEKLSKAEGLFVRYGRSSTFFGRLIPAVRQLISIPAGFSRMPFPSFMLYTGLGAGIWIIVLAVLGYVFGANKEILHEHYRQATFIAVFVSMAAFILIIYRKKAKKRPAAADDKEEPGESRG